MGGAAFAGLTKARKFGKAQIERGTFEKVQIGLKPWSAKTVGQAGDNLISFFKEKHHDFGEIRRPDLIAQCVHSGPVDHVPYRLQRPLAALPL